MHAEQQFEFDRPVRIGDVLSSVTAPGATWHRTSSSGQPLMFEESFTTYYDQDGARVVVARHVRVHFESTEPTS
jgi:hypothetical protein